MTVSKNTITAVVAKGLCLLAAIVAIISCDSIFADRSDCPSGLDLYFRYDYNMSFVNTLHKKNDCLTVYVYDSEGYLVTTRTESGKALAYEGYHIQFDIPEGNYNIIAYGGMACEKSSFRFGKSSVRSTSDKISDIIVEMNHTDLTSNRQLHNHFHGLKNVVVDDEFVQDTLYMMKNTNNIRIILQQVQGNPLTSSDFTFTLTDDNSLMDYTNKVVPNGKVTYSPWTSGEQVIGSAEEGDTPTSVAFAEFSTARIIANSGSRLTIMHNESGNEVLSIPLDKYLLLLRSELYADMQAQEYLDREDEWSMVFFLDSGLRWINTHIVINDWTVRLNHIEM